jgi:hypothetical protein
MYVRKRGNKTSFSLDVVGIKVTRPIWKLDDHGVYETYYRTIRFELYGGKVLDVYCSGVIEEYIKLRSVKRLKPRRKTTPGAQRTWWTKPGNPDNTDWLTPKLYEGTSDELPELPEPPSLRHIIASGVRDMLLDYVGQVKRLFWSSFFPPHERADSEDTVSCEGCGASYPASATGETGFVSTPYGTVRLCVDCAKKWY